jgi:hypothetical protein
LVRSLPPVAARERAGEARALVPGEWGKRVDMARAYPALVSGWCDRDELRLPRFALRAPVGQSDAGGQMVAGVEFLQVDRERGVLRATDACSAVVSAPRAVGKRVCDGEREHRHRDDQWDELEAGGHDRSSLDGAAVALELGGWASGVMLGEVAL